MIEERTQTLSLGSFISQKAYLVSLAGYRANLDAVLCLFHPLSPRWHVMLCAPLLIATTHNFFRITHYGGFVNSKIASSALCMP